ncbi:MAG TPA: hypothetical protein VMJ93_09835 [Verrucomicrobiae bacterium]|nr:hypothetical protein [Verrucomicrobiae bacterium]
MDEQKYLVARRNHRNAVAHLEALKTKQRKCERQVKAMSVLLEQQQDKLQRINEGLALAVAKLRFAKEVYGPLRMEWKKANPKQERHDEKEARRSTTERKAGVHDHLDV